MAQRSQRINWIFSVSLCDSFVQLCDSSFFCYTEGRREDTEYHRDILFDVQFTPAKVAVALKLIYWFLEFQFSQPFPIFSFYELVGFFKICYSHILPIPFVIYIPTWESISFHFTINRVFSAYFFANIETP